MFKAGGGEADARINAAALLEKLVAAGKDLGLSINPNQIMLAPKGATGWSRDSDVGYAEWSVGLPIDEARARELINKFEDHLAKNQSGNQYPRSIRELQAKCNPRRSLRW